MAHLNEASKLTYAYLASDSNDTQAEIVQQLISWSENIHQPFDRAFAQGFLESIRNGRFIEDCSVPSGASINPNPLDGTYNWHRVLFIVSTKTNIVIYGPSGSFKLIIDLLDMTAKLTLSMNVPPTFESFLTRLNPSLHQTLTDDEISVMNALPERLKHTLVLSAKNGLAPTTREQEIQCSCVLRGTKVIVMGHNFELTLARSR